MAAHVFLSPHLDDAVFSCGGLVARLAGRGERVGIITLCAADPPAGPLSPLALALHGRWGRGASPVALRRKEDLQACNCLGADAIHLSFPDAIYRRAADHMENPFLYPSEEALFGPLHPADAALELEMAHELASHVGEKVFLYCPIGIGGHVDHRLARSAAERLPLPMRYFPDLPYAAQGREPPGDLAPPKGDLKVVSLTKRELDSWMQASLMYRSQISTFWQDPKALQDGFSTYYEENDGLPLIESKV